MSRRHSQKRDQFRAAIPEMPNASTSRPHRKTLQLCEQIKECLNWVIGSAIADDRFILCRVDSVEPLVGTSRVLVKVAVPADLAVMDANIALASAASRLRVDVAQSITRRKVPELILQAVPMG
jgi:ribosome-binding factor A